MTSNFILGSGVVGMIARHILGQSYSIVPFKKSRYYSFDVPLADNHLVYNEAINPFIKSVEFPLSKRYFPTSISYGGQLIFNKHVWSTMVTNKVFGSAHPYADKIWSSDISAYDRVNICMLYNKLSKKYEQYLNVGSPGVKQIHNNVIKFDDDTEIPYDRIISTIPLNALLKLMGIEIELSSSDYHVWLINTNQFNLEGSIQCLIGDIDIPFWKVNVIDDGVYQFFANGPVDSAEAIFKLMTKNNYRILASTRVKKAFPNGIIENDLMNRIEEQRITCVGSNARWDYFQDVSTNIMQLLKYEVI